MFEIYAYGNVDTLNGVFNAIAAIMGGDDYFGLIRTVALTGVLVAAFAGLFTPGRFHGWGWLIGFMFLYYGMFVPKVDVVIVDKLGSQPPTAVSNVPIGVAFFGHYTSKVGDVMTRFFETAFQVIPSTTAQLPAELAYQKNGVMFGNRLIQASRKANIADPQLRTDLISYIYSCTLYDLQDGTINPATFGQSTDIWSLMANPNPARFSTFRSPVQVDTCPNAYAYLNNRLPAEVANAKAVLAFHMNPALDPSNAQSSIDGQLEQAYYKTKIATAAQGAADLLRQNIMINLVQDTSSIIGQKINDPAAVMLASARSNATASINSSYMTMGKIAEQALPLIRNVIEAIIYAVFPFVFLLFLLAHGKALGLAVKSFAMSLVWIQLWPPLYAILNYVATLASAKSLEAAAKTGMATAGLALESASSIYNGAVSDQAVAGYMVISIPIIATAIIKGGEVAFAAVTGASSIQAAATAEASQTSKGVVSQGIVSTDQYSIDATFKSPLMVRRTDDRGNERTEMLSTGVRAINMLQNSSYVSGAFNSMRSSELSEAAGRATEAGRSESVAAATETVAALAHTISKGREGISSSEFGNAVSRAEAATLQQTHQRIKSQASDLARKYGISDEDAAAVVFSAAGGLEANIAARASKGASASTAGDSTTKGALLKNDHVDTSGGGSVNANVGGSLRQQYQANLARAYDEIVRNTSQDQTADTNEYARRVANDQHFRRAVTASERDADHLNAQLASARKYAGQAQAHFAERETLSEQATIAKSNTAILGYDWTRDPRNSRDVEALALELHDAQTVEQQQILVDRFIGEKSVLGRPTRYGSSTPMNWTDADLKERYGRAAGASDLSDATNDAHVSHSKSIGALKLARTDDRGLISSSAETVLSAKEDVLRAKRDLSKRQVAAEHRFDKESGLGDQDHDGQFGSNQSTATRAFNNAVDDGKRSAENFKNSVEDSTFGTVFRWLNDDKKR